MIGIMYSKRCFVKISGCRCRTGLKIRTIYNTRGEISIVNAHIILIGFRGKILNKISNPASDASRSLTDFSRLGLPRPQSLFMYSAQSSLIQ